MNHKTKEIFFIIVATLVFVVFFGCEKPDKSLEISRNKGLTRTEKKSVTTTKRLAKNKNSALHKKVASKKVAKKNDFSENAVEQKVQTFDLIISQNDENSFPLAYTNKFVSEELRYKNAMNYFYKIQNIGNFEHRKDMLEALSKITDIFLALLDDLKDAEKRKKILLYLGNAYYLAGDSASAEKYLLQALNHPDTENASGHFGKSVIYAMLAEVYSRQGKYEKGREILNDLVNSSEEPKVKENIDMLKLTIDIREDEEKGMRKLEELIINSENTDEKKYNMALYYYASFYIKGEIEAQIKKENPNISDEELDFQYKRNYYNHHSEYFDSSGKLRKELIQEIKNKIYKNEN